MNYSFVQLDLSLLASPQLPVYSICSITFSTTWMYLTPVSYCIEQLHEPIGMSKK